MNLIKDVYKVRTTRPESRLGELECRSRNAVRRSCVLEAYSTNQTTQFISCVFILSQKSTKMRFFSSNEPSQAEVSSQRRPSNVEAMAHQNRKSVSNKGLTGASALTVRQSIIPITLVTILFFLWGFAVSIAPRSAPLSESGFPMYPCSGIRSRVLC